jgi:AbrB family looped-hinge helix DNA binding protein
MRITANGQVTIPKTIRDRLGLLPHTEVDFVLEGESVRLVKIEAAKGEARGARAVRLLRSARPLSMSTDEIMALTRGE